MPAVEHHREAEEVSGSSGGGKKARMKRQEEAGLERAEKSDDKKDRAEAGRFEEQGMGLGVA